MRRSAEGYDFIVLHRAPRTLWEQYEDRKNGRVCITDESWQGVEKNGICLAPKLYGVNYGDDSWDLARFADDLILGLSDWKTIARNREARVRLSQLEASIVLKLDLEIK
ncbi:hypothetical protein BJ508DRAFT_301360 [Ascobolus immersus RN42]|uniref:Uncharacterized protein n=1 Tax=Ascobolus immersus RN42 TaxID=1160509 RepID=A0A3N4IM98_ASCIM|nr:hypothetical protein BJ508DRAFT_301360 [Ascobolus immersus RN42]